MGLTVNEAGAFAVTVAPGDGGEVESFTGFAPAVNAGDAGGLTGGDQGGGQGAAVETAKLVEQGHFGVEPVAGFAVESGGAGITGGFEGFVNDDRRFGDYR